MLIVGLSETVPRLLYLIFHQTDVEVTSDNLSSCSAVTLSVSRVREQRLYHTFNDCGDPRWQWIIHPSQSLYLMSSPSVTIQRSSWNPFNWSERLLFTGEGAHHRAEFVLIWCVCRLNSNPERSCGGVDLEGMSLCGRLTSSELLVYLQMSGFSSFP